MLQPAQQEQRQDQELAHLMEYLKNRSLPDDVQASRHMICQAKKSFILIDAILYYEEESSLISVD